MQRIQGFTEAGNTVLTIPSSGTIPRRVQGSYPSCTVTIYLAGTVTVASIYSDDANTPKSNPFTSASDGTWFAYVPNGRYDVKFSGASVPAPFTIGDFQSFDENTLWVNPIDAQYGAKGDGITDDTLAFTTAINATPDGGTLIVPMAGPLGLYNFKFSSITIDHPMTLRGNGVASAGQLLMTQLTASASLNAIVITSDNVILDNIAINGTVAAGTEASEHLGCVFVTYSGAVGPRSNITIQNCYFSGKVAGIFTDNSDATNAFALTNLKFLNNVIRTKHFGIYVGGALQSTILHKNIHIDNNDIEVAVTTSYGSNYNARPCQVWNANDCHADNNRMIGGFTSIEFISSGASGLAHRTDNTITNHVGDSHLSFTQVTGGKVQAVLDMALHNPAWLPFDTASVVAIYGYLAGAECADLTDCDLDLVVRSPVGAGVDFGAAVNCRLKAIVYNSGAVTTPPAPAYAHGIVLSYTHTDTTIKASIYTSARSGIAQRDDQATWNLTRANLLGGTIKDCQEHGIHIRQATGGVKISNFDIFRPNLVGTTFNGIDFTPAFGGDTAIMEVSHCTVEGGKYGFYQPYIDSVANRKSLFAYNTAIGYLTAGFNIHGRRRGNWDATLGPVPTQTLTANALDAIRALDNVYLDPGGATSFVEIINGSVSDEILIRFARADTTVVHGSGLALQGSANVIPPAESLMRFSCTSDADNLAESWVETSRIFPSMFTIASDLHLTGVLTPTALSGNVNNYNPPGLSTATILRINPNGASRTMTGIVLGSGQTVLVLNISGNAGDTLILSYEDALSTAANRFIGTDGADTGNVTIQPGGATFIWKDDISSRVRVITVK